MFGGEAKPDSVWRKCASARIIVGFAMVAYLVAPPALSTEVEESGPEQQHQSGVSGAQAGPALRPFVMVPMPAPATSRLSVGGARSGVRIESVAASAPRPASAAVSVGSVQGAPKGTPRPPSPKLVPAKARVDAPKAAPARVDAPKPVPARVDAPKSAPAPVKKTPLKRLSLPVPMPKTVPHPESTFTSTVEEFVRDLKRKQLVFPIAGGDIEPLQGHFAQWRGNHMHHAVDIMSARHTPVLAADNGKIAKLLLSAAGGTTIYQFDPTEQYVYYYAHLQGYVPGLAEGDLIRKGQVIAYVGTSGNAPPNTPHLHFSISRLDAEKRWWKGTPIDPYEVFR